MNKTTAEKLTDVVKTLQSLPEQSQAAVIAELEERIEDFATPQMKEAQRAEVKRRLALPRRHVPQDEVRAILRRYNSSL